MALIFWLVGAAFFAVQAATLGYLLRARHAPDARDDEGRRVEIVWTLVPAAVLAALVLMLSGLTHGTWTRARTVVAPLAAGTAHQGQVRIAAPAAEPR